MTLSKPLMLWVPSPNFNSRGNIQPEAVVLHIMDGTLAGCDSWFGTTSSRVSAHYGIGKDGLIHQYVSLSSAAWTNGRIENGYTATLIDDNDRMNPNLWTISIEHEGFYPDEPTDGQFDASTKLTAWLFESTLLGNVTGAAVDRKHILRHADISPISRSNCPGWSVATFTKYINRVNALVSGVEPLILDIRIMQARDLLDAVIKEQGNATGNP